jgi:hypothetical protein
MELLPEDLEELRHAKQLLENPKLVARLTHLLGGPIEKAIEFLPEAASDQLMKVTHKALFKASEVAIATLKPAPHTKASSRLHKFSVALSGGVGGFFGLAALAVELPISTTIMLRSIADIARSYGEDLTDLKTQLACLEVFALGGRSQADDGSESGYFMVRAGLAKTAADAASHLAEHGIHSASAPIFVKFLTKIAETFNIQVTQKLAAQAVPAIGAAGGALINTLFIDHFQDMARGHFAIRHLERKYSIDYIKAAYDAIRIPN